MEEGTSKSGRHTDVCPAGCGNGQSSKLTRELLDRIGDKWSLLVLSLLGERTMRFSELQRVIGGVSQRMLTLTLRNLERDGMVKRKVWPTVPPRVDYSLTPLGRTFLAPTHKILAWAVKHERKILEARAEYDRAHGRR